MTPQELDHAQIEASRRRGGISWLGYTEHQVVAWLTDRSKRFVGPDNRFGRALNALSGAQGTEQALSAPDEPQPPPNTGREPR